MSDTGFESATPHPGYVETRTDALSGPATVESDFMALETMDVPTFVPDTDGKSLSQRFGDIVFRGETHIDDPGFALHDLAWKVKCADGKPAGLLEKIDGLIARKGKRLGFLLACDFLNYFSNERLNAQGILVEDELANRISTGLQDWMLEKIGGYLSSVTSIDDTNREVLRNDLFQLGMVEDRSMVWWDLLDDSAIERRRRERVPASEDTMLDVDHVYGLLSVVERFREKPQVRDNTVILAKTDMLLDKKNYLDERHAESETLWSSYEHALSLLETTDDTVFPMVIGNEPEQPDDFEKAALLAAMAWRFSGSGQAPDGFAGRFNGIMDGKPRMKLYLAYKIMTDVQAREVETFYKPTVYYQPSDDWRQTVGDVLIRGARTIPEVSDTDRAIRLAMYGDLAKKMLVDIPILPVLYDPDGNVIENRIISPAERYLSFALAENIGTAFLDSVNPRDAAERQQVDLVRSFVQEARRKQKATK